MDANTILKAVNDIFIDVLDENDILLKRETTAKDVEDWDSLNHIQLIISIEKHFKVRFTTQEIRGWENVGAMCDSIEIVVNKKLD
jgi:acyl carrier protein